MKCSACGKGHVGDHPRCLERAAARMAARMAPHAREGDRPASSLQQLIPSLTQQQRDAILRRMSKEKDRG